MSFLKSLNLTAPIIQAPMAGVSTPELAAAVSNAGALGSIGVGATDAVGARQMIEDLRSRTSRTFNVNVFAHATPVANPAREAAWLKATEPLFQRFNAQPPASLTTIYQSFLDDPAMCVMLAAAAVPVVSFHFGLPTGSQVVALKQAGCALLSTATSLTEAEAARAAGMDAVVAQGWEAGGHRGVFDPEAADDRLGTFALTRLLVVRSGLPVIAAGGIMDGRAVRAALDLGAVAAQLGTAFVACAESAADAAYRTALSGNDAHHTVMTTAISGRPARCLANAFTAWAAGDTPSPPAYPIAYDAGKALNVASKAAGEYGFGAQWAGQGAPLARALPAADLVAELKREAAF